MTNKNAVFQVTYDGPALVNHEINVKDLAPALLALGELLEESNKVLNGDKAKIVVNLRATDKGSVEVVLSASQSLLDSAISLFNTDGVNAVVNAVELAGIIGLTGGGATGGVIGIIKWLKGRELKSIVRLDTGQFKLQIDEEGKEIRVVSSSEVKLLSILSIRKNLETIIQDPLSKEGINVVKFNAIGKEDKALIVKDDEGKYFTPPDAQEELLDESDVITSLQLVSISFQDGGKWRFSDGNATFFAEITDENFLQKVEENEAAFCKDDILKVRMKKKQYISKIGGIKADYIILEVLEHRKAAVQIKLPFNTN